MKSWLWLGISVGVNVALAAVIAPHLAESDSAPPTPIQVRSSQPPAQAPAPVPPNPTGPPIPLTPPQPFQWHQLESDDFRVYLANLRAVGCPERLARDLIVAEVAALYERRGRALARTNAVPLPPWANQERRREQEWRQAQSQDALDHEQRATIRALLGYEWNREAAEIWNQEPNAAVILGMLDDAKAVQVVALVERYEQQAKRVRQAADGLVLPEDEARLDQLYREMLVAWSGLLSPMENEELRLRLALVLSHGEVNRLIGVELTSGELREFMRLQNQFADPLRIRLFELDDRDQELKPAEKAALETAVRRLLGEARFADYQLAQNKEYVEIFQFTSERQLPKTTAKTVYDVRQAATEEARRLVTGTDLSDDQRRAQLEAIVAATRQALAQALGPGAAQEYFKAHANWLNNLLPRPARPAPPQ